MTNLDPIIETLKSNPMFRMSLGAKELFHSNFLEFLSTLQPASLFIDMVNGFLPEGKKLPKGVEYHLDRELKDFDICIHHEENGRTVYDVVIENKVKSIPYKEQLKDYVGKATGQGSGGCRFILLTLSKDFPDKGDKEIDEWIHIGYDKLREGIEQHFIKGGNQDKKTRCYIDDYHDFIQQLNELGTYLTPTDGQPLIDGDDKTSLEGIRLHDLYIKLRCSWFAMKLKERLEGKGIRTRVVHKYKECEPGYVNINVDMNQGNGQVAAWICDGDKKDGKGMAANTFEVVIQGGQYRHGINQQDVPDPIDPRKTKTPKEDRLNSLYDRLKKIADTRPLDFLNFNGEQGILPADDPGKERKFKKSTVTKSGPFDCYSDRYLYRYRPVGNATIGQLMDWMTADIVKLFGGIPDLHRMQA